MEPTLIAGIIAAAGVALVNIIKVLYSRNQNRQDQYSHEENLIKFYSSINDVNEVINELRTSINKSFDEVRSSIDKLDRKLDNFAAEEKQINIVSLRHSITQVFHTYKDKREIPGLIYQSTLNLYDQYVKLGGNSFISDKIEEMKTWKKI